MEGQLAEVAPVLKLSSSSQIVRSFDLGRTKEKNSVWTSYSSDQSIHAPSEWVSSWHLMHGQNPLRGEPQNRSMDVWVAKSAWARNATERGVHIRSVINRFTKGTQPSEPSRVPARLTTEIRTPYPCASQSSWCILRHVSSPGECSVKSGGRHPGTVFCSTENTPSDTTTRKEGRVHSTV